MRTCFPPSPRNCALLLSVSIFAGLLACLGFYQSELSKRLETQREAEVGNAVAPVPGIFSTNIAVIDTAVSDMALFLGSIQKVDSSAEQRLALQLARNRSGLDGLAVVQVVKHADRAAFEARYLGGRSINSYESGSLVPAPNRAEYYVIRNIAPLASNRSALGLDVLSERKRRAAFLAASSQRRMVHSEPLTPVQDDLGQPDSCNLIVCPVITDSIHPPKLFVSGILRVPRITADTNKLLDQARIVMITDITRPTRPLRMWSLDPSLLSIATEHRQLYLSGRTVDLAIEPRAEALSTSHSRSLQTTLWILGAATCLLASILVASILFKRIQADEHRRELQNLATDLLTEISQKK